MLGERGGQVRDGTGEVAQPEAASSLVVKGKKPVWKTYSSSEVLFMTSGILSVWRDKSVSNDAANPENRTCRELPGGAVA